MSGFSWCNSILIFSVKHWCEGFLFVCLFFSLEPSGKVKGQQESVWLNITTKYLSDTMRLIIQLMCAWAINQTHTKKDQIICTGAGALLRAPVTETSWCYLMSLNTHAPLLPEDTTCRLQLQSHNSFVYELSPISLKSRTDPPCLVCASARASIPVRDSTFSRYWPLSLHLFDPLANHTLWLLCSKMAASSAPHHTSSHLKSKYDHLPVVWTSEAADQKQPSRAEL